MIYKKGLLSHIENRAHGDADLRRLYTSSAFYGICDNTRSETLLKSKGNCITCLYLLFLRGFDYNRSPGSCETIVSDRDHLKLDAG
jgi:hypothetical protein